MRGQNRSGRDRQAAAGAGTGADADADKSGVEVLTINEALEHTIERPDGRPGVALSLDLLRQNAPVRWRLPRSKTRWRGPLQRTHSL